PITTAEATSPDYWCRQMRAPVRFADAAAQVMADQSCIALEVGPGQTLSGLLRRRPEWRQRSISSLGERDAGDNTAVGAALGRLWALGAQVDWDRYWVAESRRRVPLPGYPFRGPRFWIDAPAVPASRESTTASATLREQREPDGWSIPDEQARTQLREL